MHKQSRAYMKIRHMSAEDVTIYNYNFRTGHKASFHIADGGFYNGEDKQAANNDVRNVDSNDDDDNDDDEVDVRVEDSAAVRNPPQTSGYWEPPEPRQTARQRQRDVTEAAR